MKIKSLRISSLIIVFSLVMTSSLSLALQNDNQEEKTPEYIPKEVKAILQQGIETQEARLDIPFSLVKNFYLPAQQNMHCIFLFKAKNADLEYTPISPAKEGEATEAPAATQTKLQARAEVFLLFKQLDGDYIKEVYIPFNLQVDSSGYNPENEEIYSVGYPLPPGNYTLAMAITALDLQKIGTQYFEFSLPNPVFASQKLETTPIFFIENLNRMTEPETVVKVHRKIFTYSVLQIEPNLYNTFSPGSSLDIFFYIIGVQPNDTDQYDISISYEILKEEETVVRYSEAKYQAPIISQPLPLKKTVVVKTTKEDKTTEKKETRDLEQGTYILIVDIKDNVSGKSLKKIINFEVR